MAMENAVSKPNVAHAVHTVVVGTVVAVIADEGGSGDAASIVVVGIGWLAALVTVAGVIVYADGIVRGVHARVGLLVARIDGAFEVIVTDQSANAARADGVRIGLADAAITDLDAITEDLVGALGVETAIPLRLANLSFVSVGVGVAIPIGVNISRKCR